MSSSNNSANEAGPTPGSRPKRSWSFGKRVLVGFGLLFVGSFVITVIRDANEDPTKKAAREATLAQEEKDAVAVDLAERGVRTILKDGDSAKFRDVTVAQWIEKEAVVCGYVNSKNSFGAYIGDTEFAVFRGRASINDHNHKEFTTLWNTLCATTPGSRAIH